MPDGLALHNNYGGHYMVCPTRPMTLAAYQALFKALALHCKREMKVPVK
jgi:hypothetical protein